MAVELWPVNKETLTKYYTIPSSFEVVSILDVKVIDDGFKGMNLREKKVAKPYVKNYDENENPFRWLDYNTSNWMMFVVKYDEKPVGGLTMACKTPELRMLNGRDNLADVWDLRVHPDFKRRGIGTKLFSRAIAWCREQGYKQLCVETQNVNVPACRFYLKQGCVLGGINRYWYYDSPAVADEVQFVWFMDLS